MILTNFQHLLNEDDHHVFNKPYTASLDYGNFSRSVLLSTFQI